MKSKIKVAVVGFALVTMTGVLMMLAVTPVYQTTMAESTSFLIGWGQAPSELGECDQGPSNPPTSETYDLDEDAEDWGVYCEGTPTWIKRNVATPSIDGKSLQCSITGGAPYSNVHCYRNLLLEPAATTFTLTLSFWFSPTTTFNNQSAPSVIQALEFTMNKWHQSKRYEFALQWQNVGDGAPQWRYWDPHQSESWVGLGITDTLQGEQWHLFGLQGEIINEQVHYLVFAIDQHSHNLDVTVSPAYEPGETNRLAIAVQLDGNSEAAPYDVFIDQVSFVRKPAAQIYLPLVKK